MKKSTFKRMSSAILAILMTLVMIPTIVLPAYADTLSGTYQDRITWKFYTSTGHLIFSGSGEVNSAAVSNSVNRRDIVKVTIEEGITAIGDSAFINCINMTSIIIPNGVNRIGEYAFYNCNNIKEINIPTGVEAIYSHTFFGCSSLESIVTPNTVKFIGDYAFYGCVEV